MTGSIAVVKKESNYKVNDVVSFNPPDERNLNVTHRVIGIEYLEDGSKQFITKGDANEDADSQKIPENAIRILKENGFEIDYRQGDPLSKEELIKSIQNVDAIIAVIPDLIDKEIINAGNNLKIISCLLIK